MQIFRCLKYFDFIEHTNPSHPSPELSDSRPDSLYSLVCHVPLIAPVISKAALY